MKRLIVLLFCFLPILIWAEDAITGSAKFIDPEMVIGEQIYLEIEIKAPKSYIINFPNEAPEIKDLQMFGEPEPTIHFSQSSNYIYKKRYSYIAYDKVEAQPKIVINYTKNDKEAQLEIQVDAFQVKRIPVDASDQMREAYSPLPFQKKLGWTEALWVLLAIVFLLALFLFLQWRKNKRKLQIPLEEEPRPWALKQINDLNEKAPFPNHKESWSTLTDVVRLYIEKSWRIPAPYQSTGETLFALSKKSDYNEMMEKVSGLLSFGDEIKFAGADSDLEEQKRWLQVAKDIVNFEPAVAEFNFKEEGKDE